MDLAGGKCEYFVVVCTVLADCQPLEPPARGINIKDFALTLSIFVFASNDHRLCTVLNAIQPGLVTNVLQHLWSRRAKKTICPWLRV